MRTVPKTQENNLPPVQVPEGETRGQKTLNGPEPVSCKSLTFSPDALIFPPGDEGEPYECSAPEVKIDAFQKEDGKIDILRIVGTWPYGVMGKSSTTCWNHSFPLFGKRESQTLPEVEKTEKK